jgi:hypothetical protein
MNLKIWRAMSGDGWRPGLRVIMPGNMPANGVHTGHNSRRLGNTQFIARDFKEFIRVHDPCSDFTLLSPVERQDRALAHQSLKGECLRPGVPSSIEEAPRLLASYVDHYRESRSSALLLPARGIAQGSYQSCGVVSS